MKPQHRKYWDEFQDHTLFKHLVLQFYVEAWIPKLVLGSRRAKQLLVVDAFAGRGSDKMGNPGSPLRLARAAAMAREHLAQTQGRDIPVHVVAIELEREWYTELVDFMRPFGGAVEVLQGTLKDHLSRLLREYPSVPSLYFLDPFGVKGLEAAQVARALAGDASEALVLFNDPGAERLAGSAGALREANSGQAALFEEAETASPVEEPSWAEGGASRDILNTAFGDDRWERAVSGLPSGPQRRAALIAAYEALLQEMGTPYTTKIPVWNREGMREYTLMHASKSPIGRKTIKEAFERALKQSASSESVKEIARRSVRVDIAQTVERLWEKFSGREVYWSEDYDPSVRTFLLTETAIFTSQLDEVKKNLAPYRREGSGPVSYRFTR